MRKELMYTDLRYRNPRCRMKAKHYTKPGKVKIFTRTEIEAYIQSKAGETGRYRAEI